jgi:glutaredoxin-like YruB-family protein
MNQQNMDTPTNNQKTITHSVKVFSTPTCPYCHMAKAYLKQKNVLFEDIDVAQDRAQAMQMVQRSGQMGVPQLWIDNAVVVGFDRPEINRLLGL